ncbi:hypothetical protein ACMATS_31695 [Streptoverticillium reticulum]|uniref:hypothetical protein n=1 Tax=Streptoverticillium reticulum TaxID=1433415 RepID=UPI0039C0008B
MRDLIVRILLWVLRILLPAHGKHGGGRCTPPAADPVSTPPAPTSALPAQPPYEICGGHKPIPPHHLARYILPPDTRPLVPRFMEEHEKGQAKEQERAAERERQRQRCVALVAAALGYDYPNPERYDFVAVTA